MTEYRVHIPQEVHTLLKYREADLPAIAVVNSALLRFEPRAVFDWHLSIIIDFVDLIDNGMPSAKERTVVDPFGDSLDESLKCEPDKPNALFLARITWNKTRQLLYRVHDPEVSHRYLQDIIEREDHPRPFDYRIDPDPKWEHCRWYFDACRSRS